MYVLSYMMEGEDNRTRLLRGVAVRVEEEALLPSHMMSTLGHQFVNAQQISAQEAVFYLLGIAFKKQSRRAIFVQSGPPQSRMLKSKSPEQLEKLDEDDTDTTCTRPLKYLHTYHASRRMTGCCDPDLCLADFQTWWKWVSRPGAPAFESTWTTSSTMTGKTHGTTFTEARSAAPSNMLSASVKQSYAASGTTKRATQRTAT
jgi:hypothetical protein